MITSYLTHSECAGLDQESLPVVAETSSRADGRVRTVTLVDIIPGWDVDPDLARNQFLKRTVSPTGERTTIVYKITLR